MMSGMVGVGLIALLVVVLLVLVPIVVVLAVAVLRQRAAPEASIDEPLTEAPRSTPDAAPRKPVHPSVVQILTAYSDSYDFGGTRDALHALGPAMAEHVLAAALDPAWADAHGVLIMTLADTGYPPALPHMREWMFHEDTQDFAVPSVVTLNSLAGDPFDGDKLYRDWSMLDEMRDELARRWDAGTLRGPTEAEWLREKTEARRAQLADRPPPQPRLSAEEHQALRPMMIALKQAGDRLPGRVLHARDLDAVERHLALFEARFPSDVRPRHAAEAARRYLAGSLDAAALHAHQDTLSACIKAAKAEARWNNEHKAYHDPSAYAASHVAQAAWYLVSPGDRNRIQAIHFSLNALETHGAGYDAVRAELQHHLDALPTD